MILKQAWLKHFLLADIFAFIGKITDVYMAIFHSVLWERDSMTKVVLVQYYQLKSHPLIQGLTKYIVFINKVLLELSRSNSCLHGLWLVSCSRTQ